MSQSPEDASAFADGILDELDGHEPAKHREAASLVNFGPQLDAIRGEGIPKVLQNGEGIPKDLANGEDTRRRRPSDAETEASRMTVWDRGHSLYLEAFPDGRPHAPDDITRPANPAQSLSERLLGLRLPSARPKDSKFFPWGSVEALVTVEEVANVITEGRKHLEAAGKSLSDSDIQDYAERVCQKKPGYHRMFAILLLLGRGCEIVLFVDDEICDSELPLKAQSVNGPGGALKMRRRSDPNTDLACFSKWGLLEPEHFETAQWAMLSPFFARSNRKDAKFYQLSDKDVLPWIREEKSVREGSYGWISKAEIHPSHHNFDLPKGSNSAFAIKHFKPNVPARVGSHPSCGYLGGEMGQPTEDTLQEIRREFEREIETLNRFSGNVHPHLISLQAAFRHGDEYCVIFPWAEGDLNDMWRTESPRDPLDKDNLVWFLGQCCGIASGLNAIHVYQTTSGVLGAGDGKSYGRHGDIKPKNILLFRDHEKPGDRGTLVITDFGLTRFHSAGTKTYFANKNVVATVTYRPPECDMEGCTISRSFDIWSLGCVLLEFVAWYLGGYGLVEEFVQDRKVWEPVYNFHIDQFFEMVREGGNSNGRLYARVKLEVHQVCSNTMRSRFKRDAY